MRADDTIAIFSTTVPTNISTSTVSASTGDNAFGSREDHVHGSTAIIAAASVAEEVAASSTTVFTTPGRQESHPSAAKMWVSVALDGSNNASYNVAATAKDTTGQYTVTIATDFSSAEYALIQGVTSDAGSPRKVSVLSQAADTFSYDIYTEGTAKVNMEAYSACFGVQV